MVPKTLDEWTLDSIRKLITTGYQESESFDFKKGLPDKDGKPEKAGLREDCCAFANSNGGFLIFGVLDAQKATGEDRIVGIDAKDFPTKFGEYPSKCDPSVYWIFKEVPIKLENGKFLQIVHIVKSFRAPHAVKKDSEWIFKKRTNKGNEDMSYDDIRLAFLNHHDRLRRVFLLKTELEEIKYEAEQYLEIFRKNQFYFSVRFDLSVLDSLWSDVYPIIQQSAQITDTITSLRRLCKTVNRNSDLLELCALRAGYGHEESVDANRSSKKSLPKIVETSTKIIKEMEKLISKS